MSAIRRFSRYVVCALSLGCSLGCGILQPPSRRPALQAESAEEEDVRSADVRAETGDETGEPARLPYEEDLGALFGSEVGARDDEYQGGRGLITVQGMSGMFLNPTSGTLDQGQLTVQYCALQFDSNLRKTDPTGHGVMAAYGICDWFEVGAFGLLLHQRADSEIAVAGPFGRVRLLREESWWPEVSIGGIVLEGNDTLERSEAVVMGSKGLPIHGEIIRGARIHGGVRQIFFDERPTPDDDAAIAYVGGEVALPYAFYLVGEVATKDKAIGEHFPFALGAQWRPLKVLGLSVAAVQDGALQRMGLYVGIGAGFSF